MISANAQTKKNIPPASYPYPTFPEANEEDFASFRAEEIKRQNSGYKNAKKGDDAFSYDCQYESQRVTDKPYAKFPGKEKT